MFSDNMECTKVSSVVRKVKKKQVRDELDRKKQAEKKKRRLEKALATSAAIRSELEKKKQMKKEEQQRLDEEGAAIAEAVALHVLLGEDADDSCKIMLKKNEALNQWDCSSNVDLIIGGTRADLAKPGRAGYSVEGISWASNTPTESDGDNFGNNEWSLSSGNFGREVHESYFDDGSLDATGISTGLIAAQALSSLHIV